MSVNDRLLQKSAQADSRNLNGRKSTSYSTPGSVPQGWLWRWFYPRPQAKTNALNGRKSTPYSTAGSASHGWLWRCFYPRPQAKINAVGDPAVESPSRGPLPASSTPPQQSRSNIIPEHLDVEATIEPTRACSQERESATSTDATTPRSPSEPTTHHSSQPAGPEVAHLAEDYSIATRDFAEEPPSSLGQQNIDGMKGSKSEGGSEGSKHTPTKMDLEEVRAEPLHAVDVNNALQPPLQIVTESLPEDDKLPSFEEPTPDVSAVGHQGSNVDPPSPHNPINNGLIIADSDQPDHEPLSIISSPQASGKDVQLRPAPHLSKQDKNLAINQRLDEMKLETEFEGEYIIQRVGTWDKGSSKKLWTTSRWQNKRVIGNGSFGTVWLQEKRDYSQGGLRGPRGIGQLRAVKTVPRDLSQGATLSQELLAFLKLKQFDHLFVKFHGWYEDTNNTFIVMEYVEHGDLSQYVQKSREGVSASRSLMEVKEITRQILEGLEVLHSKRIYHRDLKPQNILMASFDPIWVKIADFGVSKQAKNTSIRTRAGTHGYLAPEIIGCNRREYKTQSVPYALDIWSLGCLVYELLAFEPPFLEPELDEGSDLFSGVQSSLTSSRQSNWEDLQEYCRDELSFPVNLLKEQSDLPVGEEEASFIRKLLIPNPADRPTAAGALQDSWLTGLQYTSNEIETCKKEFLQLGVELDFGEQDTLKRQCGKGNISPFLPKSGERKILDLVLLAGRGRTNKALSRLLESPDCPELVDNEFKKTLLQQAVESGIRDTVELLLESTLYLGDCVGEGSLLYWALDLASDNNDMVEVILNHMSDTQSALMLAVRSGNANLVRSILASNIKNGNFSKNSRERRAALEEAIRTGNFGITTLLLDDETNVNTTAEYYVGGRTLLQLAAEGGDIEMVKHLLGRNANVNAKAGEKNGRTALQAAAERGHMEIVKLLLEKKANVNASASKDRGRRALQGAAEGGHIDVVKLLLDHGADVNAKAAPAYGRTALQAAVGGKHMEIVELLLSHNADVNALGAEGQGGRTALQVAAENGHVEMVELLLGKNARVNAPARGEGGCIALEAAAAGGHLEIVKTLLGNGAVVSVSEPSNWDYSALKAAARGGNFEIFKLLFRNGGEGSLEHAAGGGHIKIVKFLLEKVKLVGDQDKIESQIQTAARSAAVGGHLEVFELLVGDEDFNKSRGDLWRFHDGLLWSVASAGHADMVRAVLRVNPGPRFYDRAQVACVASENKNFEILQLLPATDEGLDKGDIQILYRVARERLIDYVKLLLSNDIITSYNNNKYNLGESLQAAAMGGHLDVCILLLHHEADVNTKASGWPARTALQAAAEGGHVEVVRLLLDHQADISAPADDRDGITALEAAVKSGSTTIVKMLLERRARARDSILYQGNPLAIAARAGRLDLIKLLLDYGANVNGTYSGEPPLYSAADRGHVNVVKFLLDYGADCPPLNKEWVDALSSAASSGSIELVKLLCERKCDYSPRTVASMVEAAAGRGHFDTVGFILQNAPDCAFKTDSDLHSNLRKIMEIACWTAQADLTQLVWEKMTRNNTIRAADLLEPLVLSQAVERGHIHIVELLLSYGADPTLGESDESQTVALQAAAENGDLEMIEMLLLPNHEIYILRALYRAVSNGNIDIVHRLLKWGSSNINTRWLYRTTLLHLAAESGEVDIVKLLLDHGADVNAMTNHLHSSEEPSTVLQVALFSKHVETIQLILCHKTLANFIKG